MQGSKKVSLELRQLWRGPGWQVSLGEQTTFPQDETRASRSCPGYLHPDTYLPHCGCLSSGLVSIPWEWHEFLVGRH